MSHYCPTCHRSHDTWLRLTDGLICGHCHTRQQGRRIVPFNAADQKSHIFRFPHLSRPVAG